MHCKKFLAFIHYIGIVVGFSFFCFFPFLFSCLLIPNHLAAGRSYPFLTTYLPALRCISSVYVQSSKIAICLIVAFSYSSRISFWLHFCLIFLWLFYCARRAVLNRDMLQGNTYVAVNRLYKNNQLCYLYVWNTYEIYVKKISINLTFPYLCLRRYTVDYLYFFLQISQISRQHNSKLGNLFVCRSKIEERSDGLLYFLLSVLFLIFWVHLIVLQNIDYWFPMWTLKILSRTSLLV